MYNGAQYVEEAIRSILSQSYCDFELIISDNASTDATGEICQSFAADDSRIRYRRAERNLGAAANYNVVVEMARGKFFKWAAHDDICAPGLFDACLSALENSSDDVVLAHANTRIIDKNGVPVRDMNEVEPLVGGTPVERLDELLKGGPTSILYHCSPVFGLCRLDVLKQTRLIQAFRAADAVLLVELALRGSFVAVDDYLFLRRMHDGNSMVANRTDIAIASWYDPSVPETFPMPRTRLFIGFLTAIGRAPMPPACKARAYNVLVGWLARNRTWRVIGGELKIRARELADAGK